MNKAQLINLDSFYAGDHQSFTIEFFDDSDLPMNLNNRRIVFTAKQDIDDNDNANSVSQIKKVILINQVNPVYKIVLELFTADTINKNIGQYEYDLKVSFPGIPTEVEFTAVRGQFSIKQPVTKEMG